MTYVSLPTIFCLFVVRKETNFKIKWIEKWYVTKDAIFFSMNKSSHVITVLIWTEIVEQMERNIYKIWNSTHNDIFGRKKNN